jgi:hypothetical protein
MTGWATPVPAKNPVDSDCIHGPPSLQRSPNSPQGAMPMPFVLTFLCIFPVFASGPDMTAAVLASRLKVGMTPAEVQQVLGEPSADLTAGGRRLFIYSGLLMVRFQLDCPTKTVVDPETGESHLEWAADPKLSEYRLASVERSRF